MMRLALKEKAAVPGAEEPLPCTGKRFFLKWICRELLFLCLRLRVA